MDYDTLTVTEMLKEILAWPAFFTDAGVEVPVRVMTVEVTGKDEYATEFVDDRTQSIINEEQAEAIVFYAMVRTGRVEVSPDHGRKTWAGYAIGGAGWLEGFPDPFTAAHAAWRRIRDAEKT